MESQPQNPETFTHVYVVPREPKFTHKNNVDTFDVLRDKYHKLDAQIMWYYQINSL